MYYSDFDNDFWYASSATAVLPGAYERREAARTNACAKFLAYSEREILDLSENEHHLHKNRCHLHQPTPDYCRSRSMNAIVRVYISFRVPAMQMVDKQSA